MRLKRELALKLENQKSGLVVVVVAIASFIDDATRRHRKAKQHDRFAVMARLRWNGAQTSSAG